MSTTLDPLSDPTLSSVPADSSSPTDSPESGSITANKIKKPRPPAIIYTVWGLGVLLGSIGLWFLLRPSTGTGPRPRNDQLPPLTSELGPERDFEWSEEQLATKAGWKKSLAWMNQANVALTPVKQVSKIDPWRDERWEVEYRTGHTIESYTRELDALGIEPG